MAEPRRLTVSVVTPEGAAFEGHARAVVAPAFDGEVAFFPMHAPYVGVLGCGELRIGRSPEGGVLHFYLAGGVVQVADDEVSILAETVVPAERVDLDAAHRALDEARASPATGDVEIAARLARMDDARARIRVGERAKARGVRTARETLEQPVA